MGTPLTASLVLRNMITSTQIVSAKIKELRCFDQSRNVLLLWRLRLTSILNLVPLSKICSRLHMQLYAPVCFYYYIGISFSETPLTNVRLLQRCNRWSCFYVNVWTPHHTFLERPHWRIEQSYFYILPARLMQISTVIFRVHLRDISHCSYSRQKCYISYASFIKTTHFIVMVSSSQLLMNSQLSW